MDPNAIKFFCDFDARKLLDLPNAKEKLFGIKAHNSTLPNPNSGDFSPFKRYRDDKFVPATTVVHADNEFDPAYISNSMEMGKGTAEHLKRVQDWKEMIHNKKSCYKCETVSDNLKVCGKCFAAWYCSEPCQKKHWPHHKAACKFLISMEETYKNLGETDKCASCKSFVERLKKCRKCQNVKYCSRDCQISDWKNHKITCGTKKSNGKISFEEVELVRKKIPEMVKMSYGDTSKVERIAMDFKDAERIAQQMFPGKNLTTILHGVSIGVGSRPAGKDKNKVLVCQVVGFHSKTDKHGVFMTDTKGESSFILFDKGIEDPRPYFQWSDLFAGNYICIVDPVFTMFPVEGHLAFEAFEEHVPNIRIIRSQPFDEEVSERDLHIKAYDVIQNIINNK